MSLTPVRTYSKRKIATDYADVAIGGADLMAKLENESGGSDDSRRSSLGSVGSQDDFLDSFLSVGNEKIAKKTDEFGFDDTDGTPKKSKRRLSVGKKTPSKEVCRCSH
jgi:hypothetical protein